MKYSLSPLNHIFKTFVFYQSQLYLSLCHKNKCEIDLGEEEKIVGNCKSNFISKIILKQNTHPFRRIQKKLFTS